jgi:hypothetical protein
LNTARTNVLGLRDIYSTRYPGFRTTIRVDRIAGLLATANDGALSRAAALLAGDCLAG